jgi:hypothetical protein
MFDRRLRGSARSANFWIVVNITPPEARFSLATRSFLPQQRSATGKGIKELAVEIVAVSHDHDRRILKLFVANERTC